MIYVKYVNLHEKYKFFLVPVYIYFRTNSNISFYIDTESFMLNIFK